MKNAAMAAKKWSRNLSAAGQTIKEGVQGVTVNPAEQAKAALQLMKQKFIEAIDNGKVAAGLDRTTLSAWQQAMINKGLARISDGAAAAEAKTAAVLNQIIPAVEAAKAALPARGSQAQNEQRMLEFSRAMKKFKRA